VTIGSGGGNARDVTQTKGGMELLKQSSNDRFAYYAMVIEQDFIVDVLRRTYRNIYANITPAEVQRILGPMAMYFTMKSPEDVEADYAFSPEGVFSSLNQPVRIAQWQAFRDQYAGAPFFNDFEMSKLMAGAIDLPNKERVLVPIRDPLTGQEVPFQVLQMGMLSAGAGPAGPGAAVDPESSRTMPTKKPTPRGEQGPMK
jgi:hypothetical protein